VLFSGVGFCSRIWLGLDHDGRRRVENVPCSDMMKTHGLSDVVGSFEDTEYRTRTVYNKNKDI
jgi:hypothetical protein